ncbi:MAG: hypothetical protein KAT77_03625 [Nanoarchaeota archaeon]|nr:hypothetical protein [Nanoarchaeota archaeon]
MTTFLEDIIRTCRGIKEIDVLGSAKTTSSKVTPNETPLLAVNGKKIIKIIRRALISAGGEILEPINHFLLANSARINETTDYLLLDEEGTLYELKRYNGHRLKQLDDAAKKDYLDRTLDI